MRCAIVALLVAAIASAACDRRGETRPAPAAVESASKREIEPEPEPADHVLAPGGGWAHAVSLSSERVTIRSDERSEAGQPTRETVVTRLPNPRATYRDARLLADETDVYVVLTAQRPERLEVWRLDPRRAPVEPRLALSLAGPRSHVGVALAGGHLFYWRRDAETRRFEVVRQVAGSERRRPELEALVAGAGEGSARVHSMFGCGDRLVLGVTVDDPSVGEQRVRFVGVPASGPSPEVRSLFEVQGVSPIVDVVCGGEVDGGRLSKRGPDLIVALTRGEVFPRPMSIGEKGGSAVVTASTPQILVEVTRDGPLLRLSSGEVETVEALAVLARRSPGAEPVRVGPALAP